MCFSFDKYIFFIIIYIFMFWLLTFTGGGVEMSFKVIHLSDWHLTTADSSEFINAKKICSQIIKDYGKEAKNTIILITGDITNGGEVDQYLYAYELIDSLSQANFTVWPIPGNHDYGPMGLIRRSNDERLFHFTLLKDNKIPQISKMIYPQVYNPRNTNIWLFGLNSMKHILKIIPLATGYIGWLQMVSLWRNLKNVKKSNPNSIRIVFLHHHPFKLSKIADLLWHKLLYSKVFMAVIKNNTDILLFGHEHWHFYNNSGKIEGKKSGIPYILSCGRSTDSACEQYPVDNNGFINKDKYINKALLGWEIEIDKERIQTIKVIKFK
jgi:hypothetical protein